MVKEIIGGSSDDMILHKHDMIVVDDYTLLRAIRLVEGETEGWFHNSPPRGANTYSSSTIYDHVINKPSFDIIKTNDHLRSLLRAFLEANIQVAIQQQKLSSEREKFFLTRWIFKNVIRDLEDDLKHLKVSRDEAFKKYEMLRKLSDLSNPLLRRIPC
jgi:hypothetical protein